MRPVLFCNQRRIVRGALLCRHRDAYGAHWYLADPALSLAAERTSRFVCAEKVAETPEDVTVLRERPDKTVLRLAMPNVEIGSLIVKVFRLRGLHRRLRYEVQGYNRFGLGEAANLVTAAKRGMRVPRVRGYGYLRSASGLIKTSMVVLENLAPCTSVGEVLASEAEDQGRCLEILRQVVPIFTGLYGAGCNHIDVNLGAILIDREDFQRAYLVDFEHATFGDEPSLEVLAFEAAYFARRCSRYVEEAAIHQWFSELLDAVGVSESSVRSAMGDRFDHYWGVSLSRKERRKI